MQIRCSQCHKPFALGKESVHAALDVIAEEDNNYFNAACPHCGRSNKVSRDELLRAAPGWTRMEAKAEPEQSDT
jgi:DNA-directed RNA polymerase subunit RPC12/RpoP